MHIDEWTLRIRNKHNIFGQAREKKR